MPEVVRMTNRADGPIVDTPRVLRFVRERPKVGDKVHFRNPGEDTPFAVGVLEGTSTFEEYVADLRRCLKNVRGWDTPEPPGATYWTVRWED